MMSYKLDYMDLPLDYAEPRGLSQHKDVILPV